MKNEISYFNRKIDSELEEWMKDKKHKPLLISGARIIGKSAAVRHLSKKFGAFVEINFENQSYTSLFNREHHAIQIIWKTLPSNSPQVNNGLWSE